MGRLSTTECTYLPTWENTMMHFTYLYPVLGNTEKKSTMAWRGRDRTKQWNGSVKHVPHVPFTLMTPSASRGT